MDRRRHIWQPGMRRRLPRGYGTLLAAVMLMALMGGCGSSPSSPQKVSAYPLSMTSVVCAAKDPDTVLTSYTVAYTYRLDGEGRVTERRYAIGETSYCEQTTYDEKGQEVRVVSDRLDGEAPAAGSEAHVYTYDEQGRRLTDTRYSREGTAETLVSRTTYVYGEGRLAQQAVITGADGQTTGTASFVYLSPQEAGLSDNASCAQAAFVEQMTVTRADGAVWQFSRCAYDDGDRPLYRETGTGESQPAQTVETYAYDADGRLTVHTSWQDGMIYRESYQYDDGAS